MKRRAGWAGLMLAVLLLAACGIPVPKDKLDHVGDWQSSSMRLLILADGSVDYRRVQGGVTTSVSGPLQSFEGNRFEVGIGSMTASFVVDRPPREVDGRWTMVVDGVELTRVD